MRSSRVPGSRITRRQRQALETRRLIAVAPRQPDSERGAGLIAIYQGAAAADRGCRRGRRGATQQKDASGSGGRGNGISLRPDLDATRAAAILRALCRPEVYHEIVEE